VGRHAAFSDEPEPYAAWREDRVSSGDQACGVAALAMRCRPSVDFCGYWQRTRAAEINCQATIPPMPVRVLVSFARLSDASGVRCTRSRVRGR
jgi:hypothetical protein